jgi:hypothetical protein
VAIQDGAASAAKPIPMLLQARGYAKFVGQRVAAEAVGIAAARFFLG